MEEREKEGCRKKKHQMTAVMASLQDCFQGLSLYASPKLRGESKSPQQPLPPLTSLPVVDARLLEDTLKDRFVDGADVQGWWLKWHQVLEQTCHYPYYRKHPECQLLYDIVMEYLIALYGMRFDKGGLYVLSQHKCKHSHLVRLTLGSIAQMCSSGKEIQVYSSRLVALCNGLVASDVSLLSSALHLYKILFTDNRLLDNKVMRLLVTGVDIEAFRDILLCALDQNDMHGVLAIGRVLRHIHCNQQLPSSVHTLVCFKFLLIRTLKAFDEQTERDGEHAYCRALFSLIQFLYPYMRSGNDQQSIDLTNECLSNYLCRFDTMLSFDISQFLAVHLKNKIEETSVI